MTNEELYKKIEAILIDYKYDDQMSSCEVIPKIIAMFKKQGRLHD